ncbi:hypothetical protein A3Q56_00815 [Intoshia linei]|uniref:Bardet-Biedl syndrome 4 protein n=1 Tax=Intoshia linei TaxID=1819745 RepID=A0A177BD21_9BILA|nr:hypothetical protein A3Q56_00815 [Intoshia linei]
MKYNWLIHHYASTNQHTKCNQLIKYVKPKPLENIYPIITRALLLCYKGKTNESINIFERLYKTVSTNYKININYVYILIIASKTTFALSLLDTIIQECIYDWRAIYYTGLCYELEKNYEKALYYYKLVLKHYTCENANLAILRILKKDNSIFDKESMHAMKIKCKNTRISQDLASYYLEKKDYLQSLTLLGNCLSKGERCVNILLLMQCLMQSMTKCDIYLGFLLGKRNLEIVVKCSEITHNLIINNLMKNPDNYKDDNLNANIFIFLSNFHFDNPLNNIISYNFATFMSNMNIKTPAYLYFKASKMLTKDELNKEIFAITK